MNKNDILNPIYVVIVFIITSITVIYYAYKKYTPPLPAYKSTYKSCKEKENDKISLSVHLHPYNQCLTIVMSEARKNGETVKIEKAREMCLEMVQSGNGKKIESLKATKK